MAYQIVQAGILLRKDLFAEEKLTVPKRFEDLISARLSQSTAFPSFTNPQHWAVISSMSPAFSSLCSSRFAFWRDKPQMRAISSCDRASCRSVAG